MINDKELKATQLSATKRDFYQIWNELLDYSTKLAVRWDPQATNESDPGIVLLKVVTAIADKLNYTIDKNILEAFMPSATQEDSMRKLCEMLGYNMKYYQSAVTNISVSYIGKKELKDGAYLELPWGTYFTNVDDNITYFIYGEDVKFADTVTRKDIPCMEGQWVQCKTNTNSKVITLENIDDNKRYYLPESQIASNGIFVWNAPEIDAVENETHPSPRDTWELVDNLNSYSAKQKRFKFGYDSKRLMPYIQFPDNISSLIESGLYIIYTRTNGLSGNTAARTITKFQNVDTAIKISSKEFEDLKDASNFVIYNPQIVNNGANLESLDDAYTNYKKTIGTFDTLVTCRDYMNKIYNMTLDNVNKTNMVSNIIVSDIRDDINKSITLCSFDEYGILYKNLALKDDSNAPLINNFDLVLYPFKNISNLNTKSDFVNSFKYSDMYLTDIKRELEPNKTLAHNIVAPKLDEIACIKNYLKLQAKITTQTKVNIIEEKSILNNIYTELYKNFNMRKLDFGEEIPYDSILAVIENADTRIKNVSLDEPFLYTAVCLVNGSEYNLTSKLDGESGSIDENTLKYHNKLVLRNVLAGRIPLFNYDTSFKPSLDEAPYSGTDEYKSIYGPYVPSEPENQGKLFLGEIESEYNPFSSNSNAEDLNITPHENEIIQFKAPNFKTTTTYPAYVNYYFHMANADLQGRTAIPATFMSLETYINNNKQDYLAKIAKYYSDNIKEYTKTDGSELASSIILRKLVLSKEDNTKAEEEFNIALYGYYKQIFIIKIDTSNTVNVTQASEYDSTNKDNYYYLVNDGTSNYAFIFFQELVNNNLYKQFPSDSNEVIGELVDIKHFKYKPVTQFVPKAGPIMLQYYVPETHPEEKKPDPKNNEPGYTKDGLGKDAKISSILENAEYQLQKDDYLCINYTNSQKNDDGSEQTTVVNKEYTEGTIIRPNFNLKDSQAVKASQGESWTKTTGFSFVDRGDVKGMFTLGTNQQIEIREPVIIKLGGEDDPEYINIYWERLDDEANTSSEKSNEDEIQYKVKFTWETSETKDKITRYYYTLKDGEYFCYTDKNKIDIAYVGSGTKIICQVPAKVTKVIVDGSEQEIIENGEAIALCKIKNDSSSTLEYLVQNGLTASIPWQQYRFTEDKYISLHEYQYVTLTEGDTLLSITDPNIERTSDETNAEDVTNWTSCSTAAYKLAGDTDSRTLPIIKLNGHQNSAWEIETRLNINMGPKVAQTLHTNDKIILKFYTYKYDERDSNQIIGDLPTIKKTVEIHNETNKLDISLKSNYPLQSANGRINTRVRKYEDGKVKDYIDDATIKLFTKKELTGYETINQNDLGYSLDYLQNNFGGHWTKLKFDKKLQKITFNALIPDGDFGLLAVYYKPFESGNKLSVDAASIKIFNSGEEATNHIDIDNGLKIIEINASTELTISVTGAKIADTIIIGDLDLVNIETPLNKKLIYHVTNNTNQSGYGQLLADIKAATGEQDFYYNAIMDNSTEIDLNDDNLEETIASPKAYYDYNNINNKFVISEIDSDSLSSGITLARSSRR